ncbi:HNH endonuclease signature motif containing protein [Gulosibacter faecalis]|uniref:HNH endonuclease signature motif containing protein n=1 Tax=Gulosibacter faecalis TaxID=272240 RepID=A0ABW5UZH5_9MICO|nr:HNH endonuclease signature motif containing protein [Gulosibacter faecalis]
MTCRFPGCRRPARACDTDHATAWEHGGKTRENNLEQLCDVHHGQKHHKGWSVEHLGGGVLVWKSPLGQVITMVPEPPGPQFAPLEEPPPF